MSVEVGDFFK